MWKTSGLGVLLIAACALPFTISNYHVFQCTLVLVYAIALLGLNMLTGYNGQISLGHGAFYAIGAYCAAILMDKYGVPYWMTLPVAGGVCLVAGFLFGLPALRLEGLYLALATFALGVAMPQLLKYKYFEPWTGGVQGIVIVKPDPPFGLPLSPDRWLYFFTLAVTVAMFWLGWNLLRGRVGRAMLAIRDHPIAAEAMGVNSALYKSLTFGVSAMYTGIAGALGAIAVQFVAPDSFSIFLSLSLLVGVVIGGLASIPDFQGRAVGNLWRVSDRVHVCDADRNRRLHTHSDGVAATPRRQRPQRIIPPAIHGGKHDECTQSSIPQCPFFGHGRGARRRRGTEHSPRFCAKEIRPRRIGF
jgi:branched-chain amino acid transport system permease protein